MIRSSLASSIELCAILASFVLVTFALLAPSAQAQHTHTVFAGTGEPPLLDGPYPPGQPSGTRLEVPLGNPFGIEISGSQIWITTVDDSCIYRCATDDDRIQRIAGNGTIGYSGDGGPATEAQFNWPHEVRADKHGNLYVADTRNHVIRVIDGKTGIVTTLAGNGEPGFAGDGLQGSAVQFKQPHSVVLDGQGGLLVADTVNHRLRRIDLKTRKVQTISGDGQRKLPIDGAKASSVSLFGPRSLAVDSDSIWIALREGNSIWRIDRRTNTIHHIAGTGQKGYTGDGGKPLSATFRGPKGLVIDDRGRILVVDTENHAVRRVDMVHQTVETILGGTAAENTFPLKRPHGIAFRKDLGYLVGDSEFHRVIQGR